MFTIAKSVSFVVAFVFATFLASPNTGHAATTLPFDFSSGNPSTVAIITGTSGTLNFTLDLGDPGNVFGSFGMDVKNSSSSIVGQINLGGGLDSSSNDFGSIANPPGVNDFLPNVSTWHLDVSAGFPLALVVTSQLDTLGNALFPVLTVDVTGDLQVTTTPLPGALALFAGGLGMLGWFGSRRRRAMKPNCA